MGKDNLLLIILLVVSMVYSLFIIIYEKRSVKSKLIEDAIKVSGFKKRNSKYENIYKNIKEKYVEDNQLYVFPKILLKSKVEKQTYKNMDYYIFNKGKPMKIFYLHGGSYFSNPLIFHITFLDNLAQMLKCEIILPIYPKTPKYDHTSSQKVVFELYNNLFNKNDNVVLMGDSAGGGFCLSLAYLLRDKNCILPSNIILLSPWLDVSMTNKDINELDGKDPQLSIKSLKVMGKLWAGKTYLKNPLVSPLYGNLKKMPPITLFIGTHEVLLADARKFKKRCNKENITLNYYEYENMDHVFLLQPIPESKKALRKIKQILTKN